MPPRGPRRDPEFADLVDIRDADGNPFAIEPWVLAKAAVLLAERTRADARLSRDEKRARVTGIWSLVESLGRHDKRFADLVVISRHIESLRMPPMV